MRFVSGFLRALVASWVICAGAALALPGSAAAEGRERRECERLLKSVPEADREEWQLRRDRENASREATVRLVGVLVAGAGLAMVVGELRRV